MRMFEASFKVDSVGLGFEKQQNPKRKIEHIITLLPFSGSSSDMQFPLSAPLFDGLLLPPLVLAF